MINKALRVYSVLIVEDDIDQAQTLQRLLESRDDRSFTVWLAHSVAQAAAVLAAQAIDIVLLDLDLDEHSRGLDTLDQVKPLAHKTPIVIVTGNDNTDIAAQALDRGARQYLLKPLNVENLVISIPYIVSNCEDYVELAEICGTLNIRLARANVMREKITRLVTGETDELIAEIRAIVDRLERQATARLQAAR